MLEVMILSKVKWKVSFIAPKYNNNENFTLDNQSSNSMQHLSCKKCGSFIFDDSLMIDCPICGEPLPDQMIF